MLKTFKYRLYPTAQQEKAMDYTLYLCRFLYNSMLDHRIKCYKAGKSVRKFDQINEIPAIKEEFPEYKTVFSQVLQEVGARLDKAYQNFFRRVKHGETPGFPRFKGQNQYDSFSYPQAGFKIAGQRLALSKIGDVKMKLHRPIEGKIKTCSIVRKNGKFYACFVCEVEALLLPSTGKIVGIDVGVADYAITSDGEFFPKLSSYRKAEKRLKCLQRQVSRRKKGSVRRKKAVRLLAKQHERVFNQRNDMAHKVSTKLIQSYDFIAHEDLQVKNMVQNHRLAKSINDAAWNKLFQLLAYKAESAGRQVVAVPPYFTSQICSGCGQLVPKKLSQRWHTCPHCGLSIQRDVNAAINILAVATEKQGPGHGLRGYEQVAACR